MSQDTVAKDPSPDELPPHRTKRGWSRGKRFLVGLGVFVLVLGIVVAVLLIVKPWAPPPKVFDPGPGGRRVTDNGLIANYYPSAAKSPTVLVIGGSEGGISPIVDYTARMLRKEGYTTLALSFWGAPTQKQTMEQLPLEYFTTAFDWLKKQPEVDPHRLALMGSSKGGEAAVLLASRNPQLKAVVGYTPSHVVWTGINLREFWTMTSGDVGSTWSYQGKPLPYLPLSSAPGRDGMVDAYRNSLAHLPEHPDAVIPVEKAKAPLLLICAQQDKMWPSCDMSQQVKRRAESRGGPSVTVLAYPNAGHLLSGPPIPPEVKFDQTALGGTEEGMKYATRDSWAKVKVFLRQRLSR